MLGRHVSRTLLAGRPPSSFWGDVSGLLREADGVVANLEAPITTGDIRWRRSWKMFHFRADPAAVQILARGNVRFVSLANNHTLDCGAAGLSDTLRALDAAGIRHAGAGRNAAEAVAPTILDLPGLKVGFIAATDTMRAFAAGSDRPGTNVMEFTVGPGQLAWIETSVDMLRRAGVDLIVLSLHWGPNLRTVPSRRFRRFAHAAIDRGIHVIHGHSAHVAQGVERYGNGLVLYGTGNALDDSWKIPFCPTTASFAFVLEIKDGRPARLRMVPVCLHSASLGLAKGAMFDAMRTRMKALCAALGTLATDTPDGLEV